ncbi:MAG TPA: RidA family protein, partial [Vicinamibacteria bacterium]|nr:RidA family protein [Vicinamibacteria bacterium]
MKQVFRAGPDLGLPISTAVRAGGLVYVSGVLATDDRGQVVPEDIAAQTRRTLDNLRASFAAAGTRLENAGSLHVYLTRAEDFAAMNAVYRTVWPRDPPARTTVITGLAAPGALIEIAGVAVAEGGARRPVHPAAWAPSPNPYSYGIHAADTLFLSGLVPRDLRTHTSITGDVGVQTRAVLDNAGAILEAAGLSHADVASARVYIADTADFAAMNEAYRAYFPGHPPARATVVAGLTNPAFRVEVTLVAVKADTRRAITTAPNPNLSAAV